MSLSSGYGAWQVDSPASVHFWGGSWARLEARHQRVAQPLC